MSGFLIDTAVHIHWSRGVGPAPDWLDDNASGGLVTSAISVAEVYSGVRVEDQARWTNYFSRFEVVSIDADIAILSGELRLGLARRGLQLHLANSIIAATAILRGWTVVTANVKNFEITGVPVVELAP